MTPGLAVFAQPPGAGRAPIHHQSVLEMAVAFVFESVPAQRNMIALGDPRELSWWSKKFGCSQEQLLEAVAVVGPCAAQVEQLLDGMEIVTV
jgi:hypothetical protein